MKYIIIGLGKYGHVLAEELSALGHEVIGADVSVGRVDSLKEKIASAFVIDATDEQALSVLPLNSVDVVIVAIGEKFGASIRVVALLKPAPLTLSTVPYSRLLSWNAFLLPRRMPHADWYSCWNSVPIWRHSAWHRIIM